MPNYKQIDRVLDLAAKTGDKVIVLSDHHNPYVVMTIKEYEALLHGPSSVKGLSEDELLSKINRDIAVWKASQDNLDDYSLEDFKVDALRKDEKHEENPEKAEDKVNGEARQGESRSERVSPGGKGDLGHKITVDKSADSEEDRYYIEPVD